MSRSGIMLAHPFEERRLNKWGAGPFIAQPKLDGERCRAVFDLDGHVTLYSSEENIITSVPHIVEQLEMTGISDIELDGELYIHDDNFEHIHSIVSRKVNQHYSSESMQYHVFDIVADNMSQAERLRNLYDLLEDAQGVEAIKRVQYDFVADIESVTEMLTTYKGMGYEGLIIRHPMAPYVRKRSPWMMKFKAKKEDIYEIVGYKEEVSIHGNLKNSLGALLCKGDDGTIFSVGSGFTQDQRINLWKERESLIGKYARVGYQHITTKGKVPRFPIILDILQGDLV